MSLSACAAVAASALLAPAHGAAPAQTPPGPAEWQYLQFVDALGKVGAQLWKAGENDGWANRRLMAYARDVTRLNAAQLRRWDSPHEELDSAHRLLIGLLEMTGRHYEALARGNLGDAQSQGGALKSEFERFEAEWGRVMKRYRQ